MDAKLARGQARVLISRNALLHNAAVLRRAIGPGVQICAMVKANAYGHGAEIVADTLAHFCNDGSDRPAIDAFSVATIEEAMALPRVDLPISVLRPVEHCFVGQQRSLLETAIRAGWTLTLCTRSAADDLSRIAQAIGRRATVQVMIDTGMTRSGVSPTDLPELLRRIEARPSLRLVGLASHFASGDVPGHPFTDEQLRSFCAATEAYAATHPGRLSRHIAASGGAFFTPASHLDMVRPGIALLGIDPTGKPSVDRPLRPALKWIAPIVAVHDIAKGQSVGYAQSWIAPRPTRIGVVAVGYADGVSRDLSGQGCMLLGDKRLPIVGRVSMDFTTVDLAACPWAGVGDEATVLNDDPLSPASAYALAEWSGTITYETFCRIGPRVLRVAVDPEDDVPETAAEESSDARRPLRPGMRMRLA